MSWFVCAKIAVFIAGKIRCYLFRSVIVIVNAAHIFSCRMRRNFTLPRCTRVTFAYKLQVKKRAFPKCGPWRCCWEWTVQWCILISSILICKTWTRLQYNRWTKLFVAPTIQYALTLWFCWPSLSAVHHSYSTLMHAWTNRKAKWKTAKLPMQQVFEIQSILLLLRSFSMANAA